MKKHLIAATLAALMAAGASPAEATIINYAFSGPGSGTMALNFNGSSYSLDTLSLTLGTATFTQSNSTLQPWIGPTYAVSNNCTGGSCSAVAGTDEFFFTDFNPTLASQSDFVTWSNVGSNFIFDGTLNITQVAGAVPEPATWAMMLLGFGAIGVAMRRKARVGAVPAEASAL